MFIHISGVNLGHLSRAEARLRLQQQLTTNLSNKNLTIVYGRQRWNIPYSRLGAGYDYDAAGQSAYEVGRQGSCMHRVLTAFTVELRGIDMPVPVVFNQAALRSALQGIARKVEQAPVDARMVLDGETSFNQVVGPRMLSNGYREAPVLAGERVVSGVGGGVCQVSSTLYDAVLLADLPIVSRTHHVRPVNYVPPGLDATVDYGKIDLKFANNTAYPVFIFAVIKDNRLEVRVFGKKNGDRPETSLATENEKILEPAVVTKEDTSLPDGVMQVEEPGVQGIDVRVYRYLKANGGVRKARLYGAGGGKKIRQSFRELIAGMGSDEEGEAKETD